MSIPQDIFPTTRYAVATPPPPPFHRVTAVVVNNSFVNMLMLGHPFRSMLTRPPIVIDI